MYGVPASTRTRAAWRHYPSPLAAPKCPGIKVQLRRHLPNAATAEYHHFMQVASGTVVDGKVVVEGLSLPEGTVVTVFAREDEAPVKLSPAEEAELLEALDEADRDEGISAEELFDRLRKYG
jgi:hypothetical protein